MTRSQQAAQLDILAVARPHVRSLRKESSCWKCLCPFHEEKTPSFAIYPETGRWKCYGCGQWGRNAIDFEVFRLKCSCQDAVDSLLSGMPRVAHNKRVAAVLTVRATIYPEIDWKGYVSSLGPIRQQGLALWRGYDPAFVDWLAKNEIIGAAEGCIAFPIRDVNNRIVRAHIRSSVGKRWFYAPSKGHAVTPLVIGYSTEVCHVAESQWDLLAVMNAVWRNFNGDALKHSTWVATRGSSNAYQLAGKQFDLAQIYPQNDEPGRKWAREVASILTPSRIIVTPSEYKDVNDLWKAEKSLARLNVNG